MGEIRIPVISVTCHECGQPMAAKRNPRGDLIRFDLTPPRVLNLAQILRSFGTENLTFIVPRWAKSAATLLVCAGDRILMAPPAELGPLDPVIVEMNPLERRMEQFSPLHIDATLELIREEYKNGNKQLADGLMQRLQFPLTLGSFKKSLDIGKQYLEKL